MRDFKINYSEPIVVLFGPTACGKTSLSLRLMLYLHSIGYYFDTDHGLRFNGLDEDFYGRMWHQDVITRLEAGIYLPQGGPSIPLLTCAIHKERAKFQILDMPGEHCKCPLPVYLNNLIHLSNKVILVFVLDFTNDDWNRVHHINLFSDIYDTASAFSSTKKDFKTLLVVNKVDCMNMNTNTQQNLEHIVNSQLGNILQLSPFTTEKKYLGVRRIRKKYRVIPYSSYECYSSIDMDGNETSEYIISSEMYPALLWKTIQDALMDSF
jgi:GTPase SAR1 family protein